MWPCRWASGCSRIASQNGRPEWGGLSSRIEECWLVRARSAGGRAHDRPQLHYGIGAGTVIIEINDLVPLSAHRGREPEQRTGGSLINLHRLTHEAVRQHRRDFDQ